MQTLRVSATRALDMDSNQGSSNGPSLETGETSVTAFEYKHTKTQSQRAHEVALQIRVARLDDYLLAIGPFSTLKRPSGSDVKLGEDRPFL
jgi:hypothetical protein